jgi:hypothetical protein
MPVLDNVLCPVCRKGVRRNPHNRDKVGVHPPPGKASGICSGSGRVVPPPRN